MLIAAFRQITSVTGAAPAALDRLGHGGGPGRGPFAFGWLRCRGRFGIDPPLALQLTAIPLGLVPLTFACAIVRYRLRDVEVIIKRGAGLHGVPRRQRRAIRRDAKVTGYLFANDHDAHN